MKKLATHISKCSSNANPPSATIDSNKEPKNGLSSWGKALVISCLCLAVLAGLASQPAFALGAALRFAYVTDPGTGSIFAFSITPATGVLVPLPGCAITPSTGPGPIAPSWTALGLSSTLPTTPALASRCTLLRLEPDAW